MTTLPDEDPPIKNEVPPDRFLGLSRDLKVLVNKPIIDSSCVYLKLCVDVEKESKRADILLKNNM